MAEINLTMKGMPIKMFLIHRKTSGKVIKRKDLLIKHNFIFCNGPVDKSKQAENHLHVLLHMKLSASFEVKVNRDND